MKMKTTAAVGLLVALSGCGGSSSTSSTPVTTQPPPPVTYAGRFTGTMTITGAGVAAAPVTGTTNIVQTGNNLSFDSLTLSGSVSGSFGGANATLNGNTFTGNGSYNSVGCGTSTSVWTGFFDGSGSIMNLKVVVTPGANSSNCATFQFLGELRR